MTRQTANLKLLNILADIILKYPDLRFGQILRNYEFVSEITKDEIPIAWKNEIHLESDVLYSRVLTFIKEHPYL